MKKQILCVLLAGATLLSACKGQNGIIDSVKKSLSSSVETEDASLNFTKTDIPDEEYEPITEEEKTAIAQFFSLPLSAAFLEDNYGTPKEVDVNKVFYNGYKDEEITEEEREAYYSDRKIEGRLEDTGLPLIKVGTDDMNRLLIERTGYSYDSLSTWFSDEDFWTFLPEYKSYYKEKQEPLQGKIYEVTGGVSNGEEYIVRVSPKTLSEEENGYRKIDKAVGLIKVDDSFQYEFCKEILDDEIIEDNCFSFVAMSEGREQFFAYLPKDSYSNVSFALISNGEVFQMLEGPDNNLTGDLIFVAITDICFDDFDYDGCIDVVVIIQYSEEGRDVFEQRVYHGLDDGSMEYLKELSGYENIVDAGWKMDSIKGCTEEAYGWREAVIEYLEKIDKDLSKYDFTYTRAGSEGYPEIAAIGDSEAVGSTIISYGYDGVSATDFERLAFYYVPGEGLFKNSVGLQGINSDYIYKLDNSGVLEMTDSGVCEGISQVEEVEYYWNNEQLTQEKYAEKLLKAFPEEKAVYGYVWNKLLSYSEMMDLLYMKVEPAF